MAITRVGTATASATTVTAPAHLQGDLIIIWAMHGGATTIPTLPSGFTSILTKTEATSVALGTRCGYRIATGIGAITSASQNTSTGVWTTAANSLVVGQAVQVTGTLPTGFAANTNYYVIASNLTSTTCELSATQGGAVKKPTGSASTTIDTDPTGTWTNASELICAVYRPSSGNVLMVGQSASSSSTTDTINYPALSPMGDAATGNSWVLGLVAASNLTQVLTTAFSGMTSVTSVAGASYAAALADTNAGVSSWSSTNQTVTGTAGKSVSATVEIVLAPKTNPLTSNVYQHIGGGGNDFNASNPGSVFTIPLDTTSGAGNTIVIAVSYDGAATLTSVVGAVNGSFGAAVKTALGGAGKVDTAIYMLQNVTAGLETITVSFFSPTGTLISGDNYTITTIGTTNWVTYGATSNTVGLVFSANASGAVAGTGTATQAVSIFQYVITELNGVATSGGLAGSSSVAANTTIGAGSFTPTNNDSTGGNFIWAYFVKSVQAAANLTTGILPGANFTLLNADIGWANAAASMTKACEGYVQASHAAINPAVVSIADSGDAWNSLAIALKISSGSGTAPPSGIQINKIDHFTTRNYATSGTYSLQCPGWGNLRTVCTTDGGIKAATLVRDNEGNVWLNDGTGIPGASFWYQPNTAANSNSMVFVDGGGTDVSVSWRFVDIRGASTSPFDSAVASAGQNVGGLSSFSLSPSPSPSNSNGLVLCNVGLGQGPGLAVTAPSGAIWDLCTYSGEVDSDAIENADIMAHYHNTASGAITVTFTITNVGSNNTSGGTICFIAGSSGVTVALTGQSATFHAGTLGVQLSKALTGAAITSTAGNLGGTEAEALVGQKATFKAGTMLPSVSVALTGQRATFTAGTMTASGNVTIALTGQRASFTAGTLKPGNAVSLTGKSASMAAGHLIPSTTVTLNGKRATFSPGTLSVPGVTVGIPAGKKFFVDAGTLVNIG